MNNITMCIALIATGCVFSLSGCDSRDDTPAVRTSTQSAPSQGTATTSADNTGSNRDYAERDAKNPMDQSQSSEHVKMTADIRQAVLDDDMLSMGAKNSKIITDESGHVWLRGVVYSQAEKDQIQQIARQIAGTDNVTNELEVKASS